VEAARVERRLAAILAGDIVGYSGLVEKDAAGTLAAIRKLRAEVIDPLLVKHHGRVVELADAGNSRTATTTIGSRRERCA